MAIQFPCSCGQQLSVGDELAGREAMCPSCRQTVQAPAEVAASPVDSSVGEVPVASTVAGDPELSHDEKTWGMIANLSALAGLVIPSFGNFLGPLVVYLIKKDESRFVAFHALQALFLQLAAAAVMIVFFIAGFLVCFTWFLMPLVALASMGYAVYVGVKASEGKWEEYWLVGEWARGQIR